MIDRTKFYDNVRQSPFGGTLTETQVQGMNYLLDIWEARFAQDYPTNATMWLAYALATVFHETDRKMKPIEEYYGADQPYGQPTGPYQQCYYGRGHVMLTHEENYIKGQQMLAEHYALDVPMHEYPHRMLENEPSALVLYDGMINGWFTGVGLPTYFSKVGGIEDPVNARKIINALDKADLIAGYYQDFKTALT